MVHRLKSIFLKLSRVRILLLGLLVILITAGIFIALPATVPDFTDMQCDRFSGQVVTIEYETLIWDTPEIPTLGQYVGWLMQFMTFDESGNVTGVSQKMFDYGRGKLGIILDSDNHTPVAVYGNMYTRPITTKKGNFLLFENFQERLSGARIQISISELINGKSSEWDFHVYADWQGHFSAPLDCDPAASCYFIVADYPGENRYLKPKQSQSAYQSAKATWTTCEYIEQTATNSKKNFGWIWYLILVLCVGAFGFLIYRNRKKSVITSSNILPPEEIVIPDEPKIPHEQDKRTGTERLNIDFPDIEEDLPDVWGVNDTLTVRIAQKEQPPYSCTFTVTWDDDSSLQTASDENGRTELHHRLQSKGDHQITATYRDRSGKEVSGWRIIRIVDYREEMVRIFNEMIETLNLTEVAISPEMTPRQLERLLNGTLQNISRDTIRKVIEGFEEANYSTHPVTRLSYIDMFLAIRDICPY